MSASSSKKWFARLAPYRQSDDWRAFWEMLITLVPFFTLWVGMWTLLKHDIYWALLGVIPAGALLVRVFIIQHDCGHGSMFSHKKANDWVGRVLGVLTFTPYDHWKVQHARHHATSGNLDRRNTGGDIQTLTVEEYRSLDKFGKLKYRLYRHPAVLFGVAPAYMFLLEHRFPLGAMKDGLKPWLSALLTNAGMMGLYGLMIFFFGFKAFLLIQIPTVIVAATIGIWMFYIQHQFEGTEWHRNEDWTREQAALHGSSYYDLPKPLMWVTGNIGIHHIHHLSSRIPFYKLPKVLKDFPELKQVSRLSFLQSFKCVKYTLWDEKAGRLVTFKGFARQ